MSTYRVELLVEYLSTAENLEKAIAKELKDYDPSVLYVGEA